LKEANEISLIKIHRHKELYLLHEGIINAENTRLIALLNSKRKKMMSDEPFDGRTDPKIRLN
jgi:hypothetical protein